MRHRFLMTGAMLATLIAVAPSLAGAADEFLFNAPSAVPEGLRTLGPALGKIWSIIAAIAGIVFLVMILIGGISYLSSAGNEDGTKKARTLMLDAF
ncbi:hypothetical protein HY375_01585, partial [Candidatus Berkelbacteria bacterium]|nr:hypothetical protein [Candidatus Berkelbacteria bacterium]